MVSGSQSLGESAHTSVGYRIQMNHMVADQRRNATRECSAARLCVRERIPPDRLRLRRGPGETMRVRPLRIFSCVVSRLAQIVGESSQHVDDAILLIESLPFGKSGEGVATVACMSEYVPFGVPLRILRRRAERLEFREMLDPLGLFEEQQAGRRARAPARPFKPFFAKSLLGEFAKLVLDVPAQRDRFRGGASDRIARRIACRAATPQGILPKSVAGVPEDASAQIFLAAKEIED